MFGMSVKRPRVYFRTFVVGAIWFGAVALKMVSRHPDHWSTYPPRNMVVLVVAWVVTALLLGVVVSKFERLKAWWAIFVGTVIGSLGVLGVMLLTLNAMHRPPAAPQFDSTDEMMIYFAGEATKWVKADTGADLDYSLDSIEVIEEELGRVAKDVDKDNPQQGTFGLAMGYGAYIGEVFRRMKGGSWAVDHPDGGEQSYPLTMNGDMTIFPVGWCWKRLTIGEEDNVYLKAKMSAQNREAISNTVPGDSVDSPDGDDVSMLENDTNAIQSVPVEAK